MRHSRPALTDALSRVAEKDAAAFVRVYNATSAKLYGIVVRILGREDIAEEVLQDVYLRIWQHAKDFDPARASPITWLASIARNRALDEVRRRRPVSVEEHPELLEMPSEEDIAADYEEREKVARLVRCVNALDPERRRLLLAVYFRGLTRDEVAAELGVPSATVKTWLRRSLAQLKECLEK